MISKSKLFTRGLRWGVVLAALAAIMLAILLAVFPPNPNSSHAAEDPDPVATTQIDTDGDGIINNEDSDLDGDGIVNGLDDDIDGDGVENFSDGDPANTNGVDGTAPKPVQQPLIPSQIDSPALRIAVASGLVAIGAGVWFLTRRLNRNRKKSQHF